MDDEWTEEHGALGLMRGYVRLVHKQGWKKKWQKKSKGHLPPPHARWKLLGVFLKASGSQQHFSPGRERLLGFVLLKDYSGNGVEGG